MPTHEITFKTTKVPADLPKGATVTEVSRFPVVVERRGSELELFPVPANEATKASGVVAAIHVNGEHVELTTETARQLARELTNFVQSRESMLAIEKRAADRKAAEEQAERARQQLSRLLYNHGGAPRRRSPLVY
jgi:hypothetical protein